VRASGLPSCCLGRREFGRIDDAGLNPGLLLVAVLGFPSGLSLLAVFEFLGLLFVVTRHDRIVRIGAGQVFENLLEAASRGHDLWIGGVGHVLLGPLATPVAAVE
jgi:hypothetical protein